MFSLSLISIWEFDFNHSPCWWCIRVGLPQILNTLLLCFHLIEQSLSCPYIPLQKLPTLFLLHGSILPLPFIDWYHHRGNNKLQCWLSGSLICGSGLSSGPTGTIWTVTVYIIINSGPARWLAGPLLQYTLLHCMCSVYHVTWLQCSLHMCYIFILIPL